MSCNCWRCCRAGGITRLAPSLTRAYRAEVALRPIRARARYELLRAERLLVHRDLQYLRAGLSKNHRYVRERSRKLEQAKRLVSRAQTQVEALA